jgi:hypothetical protein
LCVIIKEMTSVRRPYINTAYNQKVDDGCLEYKSIPMAVVNDIVKVTHEINDFTGIKQIYNLIPPRPKNINVMATSIARINNLPYSVVDDIAKKFIADEVAETGRFVMNAPSEPESIMPMYEPYIAENPTQSSTGIRLTPEKETKLDNSNYNRSEQVSLILGDVTPTSGVVPFQPSMSSQTEWIMSKESGFYKRDITFKQMSGSSEFVKGGFGYDRNLNVGSFREGMSSQTEITKPPSGKNITGEGLKTTERFYEDPTNRQGTFEGTPTRHLNRNDKISRLSSLMGLPHTAKRPNSSGESTNEFPSGQETPTGVLRF